MKIRWNSFTMAEENFDSDILKSPRMSDSFWHFSKFIHHGWRIFWTWYFKITENEWKCLTFLWIFSSWLKEILKFDILELTWMSETIEYFSEIHSPLSKKISNFVPRNQPKRAKPIDTSLKFLYLPRSKKIINFDFITYPEWGILFDISLNPFILFEENFEFWLKKSPRMREKNWDLLEFLPNAWIILWIWCPEITENKWNSSKHLWITSPWLEEILKFDILKSSKMSNT